MGDGKNPNPKYVVFSLFIDEFSKKEITSASDVSNPTLFDINAITNGKNPKDAQDIVINKLREHVKKYGALNEICIDGHGVSESISSGNGYNQIKIKNILEGLGNLEKELGIKVTKRICFTGCSTFSNLSNEEIKYYRDFAVKHNMEVVGSTSATSGFPSSGRYVQFTPKGEVIRDKLDTRYNPVALLGDDRTWIDYHLGKTQEEAEIAIRQDIINQAAALINYKNIRPSYDSEFENDKKMVENSLAKEIQKKDELTDKTDVLFTNNGKGAVILTSDGTLKALGDVRLHGLTNAEKTGEIGEFINNLPKLKKSNSKREAMEYLEEGLNYNIGDNPSNGKKHFKAVLLDNEKTVLVVDEGGGFGYFDIDPPKETPGSGYRYHPGPKNK